MERFSKKLGIINPSLRPVSNPDFRESGKKELS